MLLALIARFCRGLVASRQAVAELSGNMVGNNKTRSGNSIRRSQAKRGAEQIGGGGGYGGHFRAVQGFRYYGQVGLDA